MGSSGRIRKDSQSTAHLDKQTSADQHFEFHVFQPAGSLGETVEQGLIFFLCHSPVLAGYRKVDFISAAFIFDKDATSTCVSRSIMKQVE